MSWQTALHALAPAFLALSLAGASAEEPDFQRSGLFIAVGNSGRRIVSRDSLAWNHDQRWDDDDVLCDIAYGAKCFVTVGGNDRRGRLLTTRDGVGWRELSPVASRVTTVTFGNGRFVATGDGQLLHSADGQTFQSGQRLEWKGDAQALHSACGDTEAGFRYVVIGDFASDPAGARVPWRGATGDGIRWDSAELGTPPATDVAYGAGHFVVVGPQGLIESSHDGQTWQRRSAVTVTADFSRVLWTGTRFLASSGAEVWSSPDGLTWARENAAIPGNLVWAEDGRTALSFSPWEAVIQISRDLVAWQRVALPPGPLLRAVAFWPPEKPQGKFLGRPGAFSPGAESNSPTMKCNPAEVD